LSQSSGFHFPGSLLGALATPFRWLTGTVKTWRLEERERRARIRNANIELQSAAMQWFGSGDRYDKRKWDPVSNRITDAIAALKTDCPEMTALLDRLRGVVRSGKFPQHEEITSGLLNPINQAVQNCLSGKR
jgi:hypothetical protein